MIDLKGKQNCPTHMGMK